jgi:hypothetical protein
MLLVLKRLLWRCVLIKINEELVIGIVAPHFIVRTHPFILDPQANKRIRECALLSWFLLSQTLVTRKDQYHWKFNIFRFLEPANCLLDTASLYFSWKNQPMVWLQSAFKVVLLFLNQKWKLEPLFQWDMGLAF